MTWGDCCADINWPWTVVLTRALDRFHPGDTTTREAPLPSPATDRFGGNAAPAASFRSRAVAYVQLMARLGVVVLAHDGFAPGDEPKGLDTVNRTVRRNRQGELGFVVAETACRGTHMERLLPSAWG